MEEGPGTQVFCLEGPILETVESMGPILAESLIISAIQLEWVQQHKMQKLRLGTTAISMNLWLVPAATRLTIPLLPSTSVAIYGTIDSTPFVLPMLLSEKRGLITIHPVIHSCPMARFLLFFILTPIIYSSSCSDSRNPWRRYGTWRRRFSRRFRLVSLVLSASGRLMKTLRFGHFTRQILNHWLGLPNVLKTVLALNHGGGGKFIPGRSH